jgi:EAL domain-containing protein (putative c-di-GMP-specific phosphodiesterase class I)
VRWTTLQGDERGAAGLVAASMAEKNLPQLGQYIWRKVIFDMKHCLKKAPDLRIAVNITAQDLNDETFAAGILALLLAQQINPGRITIEVTEHSLIDSKGRGRAQLFQLRSAGMRIALDDFGTGFSSLAYLKDLPVDVLKIDSGFSRDASGNPRERAIISAVIQLARTLDLAVVAEGVESEEQLDLLREMGCTYYQGYLRSRPLTAAALLTLQ